jgi:hypothetical protein
MSIHCETDDNPFEIVQRMQSLKIKGIRDVVVSPIGEACLALHTYKVSYHG